MRIAILGTGTAGTTLAGGLVAAGHDVVFGSRTPDAKSGLPAPVLGTAAAIEGSDLVIGALLGSITLEALTALRSELAGHVLLELGNAVTPEFELMYPNASLGEAVQAALPQTKVVKSINTLGLATLVAPSELSRSTQLFLSGEDSDAKALVSEVLTSLGWPATQQLDLGGIATARAVEHYLPLFYAIAQAVGPFNIAVVR